MEKFRQVQRSANFITPEVMLLFNQITKGSPLLPRDVLTMMLYNRWFAFDIEGVGWRWPVQAVSEVSQTLDVLGEGPLYVLVRFPEGWRAAPITAVGGIVSGGTRVTAGPISIPAGATVTASWAAEVYDDTGLWDPAQPTRLTFPENGYANANVQWDSTSTTTGQTLVIINQRNSAGALLAQFRNESDTAGGDFVSVGFSGKVSAGDYLEVQGQSTNARTIDIAACNVLFFR